MAEAGKDGGSTGRDDRSKEQRGADAQADLMAVGRKNYKPEMSNTGTQVTAAPRQERRERDNRSRRPRGGEGRTQ